MRINFTIWNLKCTGGNRCIFETANGLADRGHDVSLTATGGDPSWFPLKAEITVLKTPFKYPSLPHMGAGLVKLAAGLPKADIQVATWCLTAYPVKLSKGKKFYRVQHYEELFFDNFLMKWLARQTYDFGFEMMANSLWLQEEIEKKHGVRPHYVPNAIDSDFFRPLEKEVYSDYYPKKEGTFRIISLAKDYVPWKGLADLIAAMKLVNKEIKNTELLFYGIRGPEGLEYPHTFVKFPSDEELVKLYNSADLVVCPSWYESFPLPPLEAMACGTPIVTTRIGTRDYAKDGKNSLVVEPKSPRSLADAIKKMLTNEKMRKRMSKAGRKTAEKFTWERNVKETEKLFKEALDL